MLAMGILLLGGLNSCNKGGGGQPGNLTKEEQKERAQVFSVYDVEPTFTEDNTQYDVKVFFTQPVDDEEAVKIFPSAFVEKYNVTTTYLGDRKFNFQLNNIERKDKDTKIELELNGKPLNSKTPAKASSNSWIIKSTKPIALSPCTSPNP